MFQDVLAIVVLLSIGFVSTRVAAVLRCPHSVFLVLLGLAGGVLLRHWHEPAHFSLRAEFSDIVLFVLLPPLIFESAFHLDLGHLRRDLIPVVALSTFGLVLSCVLIGIGLHVALGVPYVYTLLFGALISATDPVAVVALFKEMGAPRRLATLVEGESLLNDGTAIVLFRILLAVQVLSAATALDIIRDFIIVTASGLLVGGAFIIIATRALRFTEASAPSQIGLTVCSAYGSFLVADLLHSSGVIATLVVGLYLGNRARLELNREAHASMQALWEFLALAANTLVFLAVGFTVRPEDLLRAAPLLPATLAVVYVARAVSVLATLEPLRRRWKIGLRYQAVLIWGGLRGGLALALVLLMPVESPMRPAFLAMATAVVLSSLLINAATTKPLMRLLKLDQLSQAERILYRRSLLTVLERVFATLRDSARHGSLSADLVNHLESRAIQSLDVSSESMPVREALAFDFHHTLLEEQRYYDEQVERGILSVRAYETLSRWVSQRVGLLRETGADALPDFAFDVAVHESWLQRRLGLKSRVQALGTTLETLLHLEIALRGALSSPHLEKPVRDTVERWLRESEEKLAAFHHDHPQLEMAVQSDFVARTVASIAHGALNDMSGADAISAVVHAQAGRRVAHMRDDLAREARSMSPAEDRPGAPSTPK